VVLEKKLKGAGFDVIVVNMSLAGETTTGAVQRLPKLAMEKPDIVMVQLGGNDALRGIDPYKVTYQNLFNIVHNVRANMKVGLILAGIKAPSNMGKEYERKLDAVYKQVAGRGNMMFYPFFLEGVAGEPQYNLADGYHPNAQGTQILVDRLYPYFDRLVRWAQERKKIREEYNGAR
jgi:acyl-CoA thioesterase-1